VAERDDLIVDWTLSPRIVTIESPSDEITLQDLHDTLRFQEAVNTSLDDTHLIESAGKEPLGGGVLVGITSTLQNSQVAFESRTTSICSGTATSADPNGRILIDTVATFSGINVGATIMNFTDKSCASVISVDSDTQITHYPLDDGTENDWDIGDEYKIWNVIQCEVSGGNLVAVDSLGAGMDSIRPTAFTQIVRTSSSSATLQELANIQYSSFNGGVTIDVTSSYSGTDFPIGTLQQPVNNLTDALIIANSRGFTTLYVIGDLSIHSGLDISGFNVIGESMTKSEIDIGTTADVTGSEFYDAYIKGTLDGNAVLSHCRIEDLNYISGYVEQCVLDPGTITLSGTSAHFLNCWSGVPGLGTPTIDMGGSGTALALRNYNGGIKLINKNGSEKVSIDLNSGQVILDSTVTNGDIVIRGIGKLTDNSVGANVISENLLTGDAGIWEVVAEDYDVSTTFGGLMNFMNNIEGGRWDIQGTQMVFYKSDNVTEIARFNLYDSAGNPTTDPSQVYERRRV